MLPGASTLSISRRRAGRSPSDGQGADDPAVDPAPLSPVAAMHAIRAVLTEDLLKPQYRNRPGRTPTAGHCYAASEALFHLLGGKAAGLTPMQVRHEGVSHWFLRTPDGPLDPTADQFTTPVSYRDAVGRGFLTREPSTRAAEILRRVATG